MAPSAYDLLEVDPSATAAQIRDAFHASIFRVHPDRLPPDAPSEARAEREAATRELLDAYHVLEDAGRRADYDAELWAATPARVRLAARLRRLRGRLLRRRLSGRLRFQPGRSVVALPVGFVVDLAWSTRSGQWMLVTLAALVTARSLAIPLGAAAGPLALASAVCLALVLARGGEPTPLVDAARLAPAAGRLAKAGGALLRMAGPALRAGLGAPDPPPAPVTVETPPPAPEPVSEPPPAAPGASQGERWYTTRNGTVIGKAGLRRSGAGEPSDGA